MLSAGGQVQAMAVGAVVEVPLAWKPKLAEAPAARVAAQLGALMVHRVPLVVMVAFHAFTRLVPDGTVQPTVQLFHAEAPVFFTVTLVVKPPCQELAIWYVTAHDTVPEGVVVGDWLGEVVGEVVGVTLTVGVAVVPGFSVV
jgi:hypothetical protein